MKVKTISVTYDRKFNLGDYNSLHLAVTYWADVEEGEGAESVVGALQEAARQDVRKEFARLREKPAPA